MPLMILLGLVYDATSVEWSIYILVQVSYASGSHVPWEPTTVMIPGLAGVRP